MKNIFQATDCLSQEEIHLYTKDELSDDQRYKVENHLIDCPLCSEAVEGYALMPEKTEATIIDLHKNIDAKIHAPVSSKRRTLPWNRIAASLLFLMTLGAAYMYYQSNQTDSQYMAYFENGAETFATRGIEESPAMLDMKNGIQLFKRKNYHGSLSFFEDYLKTNPESSEATYFAGLSALNIGEKERALDFLTTARVNSEDLYEEATWRIAGIYLEKNEEEKAKVLLKDLLQIKNGFYTQKARDLLEEL